MLWIQLQPLLSEKNLRLLNQTLKKTIIMVTHNLNEAFEVGDEVVLMQKGTLLCRKGVWKILSILRPIFLSGIFLMQKYKIIFFVFVISLLFFVKGNRTFASERQQRASYRIQNFYRKHPFS